MDKRIVIKLKDEFSSEEINIFKKIVLEAKQVSEETFDGLMSKNPKLLFCRENDLIIGVGALKIPYDSHKKDVFRDSKTDCVAEDFTHELGWIVSIKEGKGIGKMLTKELADYMTPLYATVREENKSMCHILEQVGFTISGEPYISSQGDYNLCLYVKRN